jgi:hypothetical protein
MVKPCSVHVFELGLEIAPKIAFADAHHNYFNLKKLL